MGFSRRRPEHPPLEDKPVVGQPVSYRDFFAVADLPAVLTAAMLSRLAGRMLLLALVLYVLGRFASPALAGWVTCAAVAPGLMISPLAGAFLDRIGSASAVTVDMIASTVLIALLVAADQLGWVNPVVLLILVGLFSLTSPLSTAGIRVLLPRLVPVEALDRANALDTAIHAAADVLGPALTGLIVAFAGPAPALTLIALTFGMAAVCIARVRLVPNVAPSSGSLLHHTLEGVRVVMRHPTLRGLAVSYILYQVAWGILVIAVPVFMVRTFANGAGETMTGFLWAATGIAGGLGALLAGQLRTAGRERPIMAAGMLATALAAWSIAAELGSPGLVLGLLMAGFAEGPIDVGLLTLRQRRTDPALLGRVLSVSISLNTAGFPLGSAFAGMLITRSLSVTFLVAGVIAALAALAVRLVPTETHEGPCRT